MNILPKISFFLGPILWQKPGENHHILIQSGDYLSGIPRDMISGEHSFVPANIPPKIGYPKFTWFIIISPVDTINRPKLAYPGIPYLPTTPHSTLLFLLLFFFLPVSLS